MIRTKSISYLIITMLLGLQFLLYSCKTTTTVTKTEEEKKDEGSVSAGFIKEDLLENSFFLKEGDTELFRVYLSSDFYVWKQYGNEEYITKKEDPGGDQNVRDAIQKLNKIDEEREGIVKVSLYYGSGTISKIRPIRLTFLEELDRVMVDDIQRWQFLFPKRRVRPARFLVRYRFKLQNSEKAKKKTMAQLEQEYLEKNPKFYKYLMRKKRMQEKQKKQEQQ